jgi:hypothetical protein
MLWAYPAGASDETDNVDCAVSKARFALATTSIADAAQAAPTPTQIAPTALARAPQVMPTPTRIAPAALDSSPQIASTAQHSSPPTVQAAQAPLDNALPRTTDGVESSRTMQLLQEQMESLQVKLNLLRNAVHQAVQSQPSKAKESKGSEAKCPACKGALIREGKRQVVLSCFHVVCAKCFASTPMCERSELHCCPICQAIGAPIL